MTARRTSTARKLSTVPDPKPKPSTQPPARKGRPKSLANAAASSEREMLVVLRNKLAKQIESEDAPAHSIGRMVREFRQIDKDIRELDRQNQQQVQDDSDDEADEEAWDDDQV